MMILKNGHLEEAAFILINLVSILVLNIQKFYEMTLSGA
jgi:hypothetical protein